VEKAVLLAELFFVGEGELDGAGFDVGQFRADPIEEGLFGGVGADLFDKVWI
jgi:hypothetical protein